MIDVFDKNVGAIKKDVRELCYFSRGALSVSDVNMMSPVERQEWVKMINEANSDKDIMRQELI